jgi:hypothetical protein
MPFPKLTKEARERNKLRRAETRVRIRTAVHDEAIRACFAYIASVDGKPTSSQARAFASYLVQNGCTTSVPSGRVREGDLTRQFLARTLRAFLTACRPSLASRRKLVRDLRAFARLGSTAPKEVDELLAFIGSILKTGNTSRSRPAKRESVKPPIKPSVRRAEIPRCYEVLGCSPDDTNEMIKRRYRQLAATLHPDKHAAKVKTPQDAARHTAEFQQLQLAYEEIRRLRQMGS